MGLWSITFLFWMSLWSITIVFFGYPFLLYLYSLCIKRPKVQKTNNDELPSVSLLVVFRNAENLIEQKLANSTALHYPKDKLQIIVVSDGSYDQSVAKAHHYISNHKNQNIKLLHFDEHLGKSECINRALAFCSQEIILFSDVDALLLPTTLNNITPHFLNDYIGGVCGQRVVGETVHDTHSGQEKYIKWDSTIKSLEKKCGVSISSHDGKLYAIRKKLFEKVPESVTDDSFICYSVIKKHYQLSFEPEAKAYIKLPSRNTVHEVERRIRIVSTSLNGLMIHKSLFNPFHYGFFAIGLFINKIMRRCLPFFLPLLFTSSWVLAIVGFSLAKVVFTLQILAYLLAISHPFITALSFSPKKILRVIYKISGIAFFFCVGMHGTFLGVITFLSGKKIKRWDPVKES